MRVYHRRGRLIGESQERIARAKPLRGMWGCPPRQRAPVSWSGEGGQVEDYARRGDEVDPLVDLASIGWKSPLDRLLRSRMATRPSQFTGVEERHTPKSELLHFPKTFDSVEHLRYISDNCVYSRFIYSIFIPNKEG